MASPQRAERHVRFDMNNGARSQSRHTIVFMEAAGRIPVTGYFRSIPWIGYIEPVGDSVRSVLVSSQLCLLSPCRIETSTRGGRRRGAGLLLFRRFVTA